jgi:chromosome segregation ATPase
MSPSEYQELVAFLTGRFADMDRRLDHLTLELSRRLTAVDERIASLRAEVDERFREVSGHFDEIYRRLERLEQEYYAISRQLRRIEMAMTDDGERREILERDLVALRERVNVLQARLDDIERRLAP